MPNRNEILDEKIELEEPLPKINPFDEDLPVLKKGLRKMIAIGTAIISIVYVIAQSKNSPDFFSLIMKFFSVLLLLASMFILGYILSLLVNVVIWGIGKFIIEPTRNRKIITFYRYIYLDRYLGFVIMTVILLYGFYLSA